MPNVLSYLKKLNEGLALVIALFVAAVGIALQFLAYKGSQEEVRQREAIIEQMRAILQPKPVEKEFPVKLIAGKIGNGVINLPIGKGKYPIITNDASTIFTRTKMGSTERRRYGRDAFFYLFLKWVNSNFHQGWLLLHDKPVIDMSQWHEPLADKNVDNSNIITFAALSENTIRDNIFFSNPELFKDGKFISALHTKFPIEDLSIILPPQTTISFSDSQDGIKIVMDNDYCNVTFQLTGLSSGPGLPLEMLDPNKKFSEEEFYKYFTVNYQISFRAYFKDTDNFSEQKKYEKWVDSLINYFQPYFDWNEFRLGS